MKIYMKIYITAVLYEDFKKQKEEFDFSEYPKNLYSFKNKKVICKMDEINGIVTRVFVDLRPKIYSLKMNEEEEEKKRQRIIVKMRLKKI